MSDLLPRRTATGMFVNDPEGAATSTERAPRRVVVFMALAQLGIFVGLLAPVTVSLVLKIQTLMPLEEAIRTNGYVLGVAAFAAMLVNPLVGRLSDLTTSRWGRRRPWMAAGGLLFILAMLMIAFAMSIPVILIGWIIGQIAGNMVLAPLLATISDQIPASQRGAVSANVGVMQNIGILLAAYLASLFVANMLLLFVVPGVIAFVLVAVYCIVLPDRPLTERPETEGWKEFVKTFWINPVAHPNFAWVWISKFLITLGMGLFGVYRLGYMQEHIGLSAAEATAGVAIAATIFTITLVISAKVGGWLSDRLGTRKPFVFGATVVMALSLAALPLATDLTTFYIVEAFMGIGYGMFVAVDMALVLDVLPNPADAARDLGVVNIANALPQSVAPFVGGVVFALASPTGENNYTVMFIVAGVISLIGALAIIPVKRNRVSTDDTRDAPPVPAGQ